MLSPTRCLILCLAVASGEAAFVLPQAAGEVVHGALQQARGPVPACGRSGLEGRRRSTQRARGAGCTTCRAGGDRSHDDAASSAGEPGRSQTRRQWLLASAAAMAASVLSGQSAAAGDAERHMNIEALHPIVSSRSQAYFQRFPVLFAPLYGSFTKKTTRRKIGDSIWALEQNLELGPLETPLRSVVVRLNNGALWVHAPLAPTEEYFELVESCADGAGRGAVAHVVIPTYALEHKVFAKDALERWPNAQLWVAPGQFSFPFPSVPDAWVFGRAASGVLAGSDAAPSGASLPPWSDEIQFETLAAGTFNVGASRLTFYETAFFHAASRSLIVTDALAQISEEPPALSSADKLLLISKKSTADAFPADSTDARQVGWEKTALLVSYFFPEHEELDGSRPGVVTWTDGWHDNFKAIAGRLLVPPVVRTLIYAQDPGRVQAWVDRVAARWEFEQIVPAHWAAPIKASPRDFTRAFAFLRDDSIDAFPRNDLARGLQPLADIFVKKR